MPSRHPLTRRRALGLLGAAVASGAVGAPPPASAQPLGVPETVQEALRRLFADRPLKDGRGEVKLEVPIIAENGAVVPVSVEVASPMTAGRYVKHIYIVADRNPVPVVTRVALTPDAGQAYVAANIRLADSGDVRAIVEQSDGTLLQVKRAVRVTISGCADP